MFVVAVYCYWTCESMALAGLQQQEKRINKRRRIKKLNEVYAMEALWWHCWMLLWMLLLLVRQSASPKSLMVQHRIQWRE